MLDLAFWRKVKWGYIIGVLVFITALTLSASPAITFALTLQSGVFATGIFEPGIS